MISLTAILELMFDCFEVGKVLVIAPLRVARTVWPGERDTWDHVSFLRMSVMVGSEKQREAALRTPADVYVINRENVKWLVNFLEKHGMPWPFDMVVIDELSGFRNPDSQRWKALRKVRPFIRRITGLTGTPAGNGLLDLWAELYLIDRGRRLGPSLSRYRDTWFRPAAVNPHTGMVYSYLPKPGAEAEIHRRIADLSVSMKAKDFLAMPDCLTVTHEVEMDAGERALYDALKRDLRAEIGGETLTAQNPAVLSGKLLQLANGALYDDEGNIRIIHDKKLEALLDLIEQANGQPVLVCTWFRHDRQRIRDFLAGKGLPTRELKNGQDLAEWNEKKIPVALISPASAGHGLNIQQGGHILIWFSMVWSLELYQQTNARLWRQGQKEVVTIHHIVTKHTIDKEVLSALQRKDTTQQNLINAVKAHLTF